MTGSFNEAQWTFASKVKKKDGIVKCNAIRPVLFFKLASVSLFHLGQFPRCESSFVKNLATSVH